MKLQMIVKVPSCLVHLLLALAGWPVNTIQQFYAQILTVTTLVVGWIVERERTNFNVHNAL